MGVLIVQWYGKGCEHQCCQWEGNEMTDGPNYKDGFPSLIFCNHEDNPDDSEGNCNRELCQNIIEETIEPEVNSTNISLLVGGDI